MESDYDDVIAPSEFFGTDEKGDAAFGEHGFGAEERNPIYQGEYHEYEGGEWVEMHAPTQMLANANSIYAETGMSKPAPAKPMVHHPKHPGGITANAMTVAQYEAKLGKTPAGKLLPKGVGGLADYTQYRAGKKQSLYYKAAEQQARDAYLAHHARQAQIQAQAAAKDKAQVKAFDAKVARELSKLNQMDAMAETVNFIDGPEVRVCLHPCARACSYDYMYVYLHARTCAAYTRSRVRACTCSHANAHTTAHPRVHTQTYARTSVHTNAQTYTHTHTHTHTHRRGARRAIKLR